MSKKDTTESEKSDKSDKSDKSLKARFGQRILAFIIDVLIVSVVASFIVAPFIDNDSLLKLAESDNEIREKYFNGEINEKTYFSESMSISYQLARQNGLLTFVTLFLEIVYFVVFQFYKGGQTIGKKLMKIKVISTDGELNINQMVFRSLIIDMILLDMISFAFVIFSPIKIYFYGVLTFSLIQYLIIFVSAGMICVNKRGQGLHDLISHTEVIVTN